MTLVMMMTTMMMTTTTMMMIIIIIVIITVLSNEFNRPAHVKNISLQEYEHAYSPICY